MLFAFTTGFVGVVFAVGMYNEYAEGLPDPKAILTELDFEQPSIVYDRTGTVELARLGSLRREVIAFDQIPAEMLDATTAIEDQEFWTNPGFDPVGIVSAGLDTISGRPRGASTITQQLVRKRLLPDWALEGSTYDRKFREIIQSVRLTEEFPGDEGKQAIITAYLNNNFYGNNTYGIKAAALGYFGKELSELSLAQHAVIAAIPQSPTKFDLMANAEQICLDEEVTEEEECETFELVVPPGSEIAVRRDYILELMKTNSPKSGELYTARDYEQAKRERIVLTPPSATTWKAAHFVWQVRNELGRTVCPDTPTDCALLDVGGYRIVTTLDWEMQRKVEKWVYTAGRAPNAKDAAATRAYLKRQKIPSRAYDWVLGLRGKNIHNAASAVMDYRTGEILAYAGSAGYSARGTERFHPQFDVLSQGWRQPGSSIKPIDYAIGIEDQTVTAATMFMDVVTDFGNDFTPRQADGLERGPVRLRSALQFSFNVPAIKQTLISGLDHVFERTQDFGIRYEAEAVPVTSMGIGTLETHPIDMVSAYGTIANGGLRMPRTTLREVYDDEGVQVWPVAGEDRSSTRVISRQAAFIVSDILAGNTQVKINPYWGRWAIYEGDTRRPAAYKTGTTSDNKDVHAYGYLAPPKDDSAPALVVGVWMGNSNSQPTKILSLDAAAPLWSAIMTDVSKGLPIAKFSAPKGVKQVEVDAFTGRRPGPFTRKTVTEYFIDGTIPKERETLRVALDIDAATGLRWQDGCAGPRVTRGYFDLSEIEANFPDWQKANRGWAARAARGAGIRGGPEGTRTSYFHDGSFAPFGRTWGAPFPPSKLCPIAPVEPPPCDPLATECPTVPPGESQPPGPPTAKPTKTPKPPG